jgi:hypothetical protein
METTYRVYGPRMCDTGPSTVSLLKTPSLADALAFARGEPAPRPGRVYVQDDNGAIYYIADSNGNEVMP